MLKAFKEFAIKGNAVDMAVGIIIGAAFGSIVSSLVKDIIMPPISALTGGLDFSNKFIVLKAGKDGADSFTNIADAVKAGAVTWNYGNFISLIINFLIVAFAIFLIVKQVNRFKGPPPDPATRECPQCTTMISTKARRCPACTSDLQRA